ncbi:MAG: hypothetical protein PHG73_07725, partial [Pygmaiobacter sp.]|nr:hypothetical protein [Pygmaiobacter sp.]
MAVATATGIALGGSWGANYTLTATTATAKATITKKPAADLAGSNVTFDVAQGTFAGLGDQYEYSLDGGKTWQTAASGVAFVPGEVLVRTKATATAEPSNPEQIGTIAPAPAAPTLGIDYAGEQTTHPVPADYEYTTDPTGATGWQLGNGGKLPLEPGTTYIIRKAATAGSLPGMATTLHTPTRPAAPQQPTIAGSTDTTLTVSGSVPGQEYSVDGIAWQPG